MKAIFIIAGHGLSKDGKTEDNGASSGEISEYKEVADIVSEIESMMNNDADLTKSTIYFLGVNERMSLPQKIKFVNDTCRKNGYGVNDALVVELHCNFSKDPEANGIEAWIGARKQQAAPIANALVTQLSRSTGLRVRRKAINLSTENRLGGLGICDDTNCMAVLVEVGFISSPRDASVLLDTVADDEFAKGIINGLRVAGGFNRTPDESDQSYFGDVPSDSWFAGAVKVCTAAKLFDVPADRMFRPAQTPTRAELAAFGEKIMDWVENEVEKIRTKLP